MSETSIIGLADGSTQFHVDLGWDEVVRRWMTGGVATWPLVGGASHGDSDLVVHIVVANIAWIRPRTTS